MTSATAAITFNITGTYTLCYKVYRGAYVAVGSTTVTVGSTAPTIINYTGPLVVGKAKVVTLSGGSGLSLGNGQDTVKVVHSSATCNDTAAEGTSEVLDLGPDDIIGATAASMELILPAPGLYKVCYRLRDGDAYVAVGASTMTVVGTAPTSFSYEDSIMVGVNMTLTLDGGSGLTPGLDTAKVVSSVCTEDPAGGSNYSAITNTVSDATSVDVSFSWALPGKYKVVLIHIEEC